MSLKVLSVYAFFLTTVLFMPLMNVFLAGVICNDITHGIQCNDG